MQYIDIVQNKLDNSLAERLGFKRLFTIGENVVISDNPNAQKNKKVILLTSNDGLMLRNISQSNVIGAIITNNKMQKSILEKLVVNEKRVFIITKEITNTDQHNRIRKLHETRKIVSLALNYKAKVSLISLAESKEQIMSVAQMMELGKFIGLSQEQAKEAVTSIGKIS